MTPTNNSGPKRRQVQTARNYLLRGPSVPKFIAMATGVGRGKILMIPSNSPGPKIGSRCEQHTIIF